MEVFEVWKFCEHKMHHFLKLYFFSRYSSYIFKTYNISLNVHSIYNSDIWMQCSFFETQRRISLIGRCLPQSLFLATGSWFHFKFLSVFSKKEQTSEWCAENFSMKFHQFSSVYPVLNYCIYSKKLHAGNSGVHKNWGPRAAASSANNPTMLVYANDRYPVWRQSRLLQSKFDQWRVTHQVKCVSNSIPSSLISSSPLFFPLLHNSTPPSFTVTLTFFLPFLSP